MLNNTVKSHPIVDIYNAQKKNVKNVFRKYDIIKIRRFFNWVALQPRYFKYRESGQTKKKNTLLSKIKL